MRNSRISFNKIYIAEDITPITGSIKVVNALSNNINSTIEPAGMNFQQVKSIYYYNPHTINEYYLR